jgi:hypothetical protein
MSVFVFDPRGSYGTEMYVVEAETFEDAKRVFLDKVKPQGAWTWFYAGKK